MARQFKGDPYDKFSAREVKREISLVGGGKRSYLWVGPVKGEPGFVYTFSGEKFLRALAKAIMKEVGRG